MASWNMQKLVPSWQSNMLIRSGHRAADAIRKPCTVLSVERKQGKKSRKWCQITGVDVVPVVLCETLQVINLAGRNYLQLLLLPGKVQMRGVNAICGLTHYPLQDPGGLSNCRPRYFSFYVFLTNITLVFSCPPRWPNHWPSWRGFYPWHLNTGNPIGFST